MSEQRMVEAYIDGHWIAVGEGPYERVMVGWCEVFHPKLGVVAVLPRNYPLRYQPDPTELTLQPTPAPRKL